jgi:hypothetical protein
MLSALPVEPSGPMPTLTTQALAESAHQIKGQWEYLAALSVRFYPLDEQFCIMMANCVANETKLSNGTEMTPHLHGAIVSAEFSSCLDDEEHSDAGDSRK